MSSLKRFLNLERPRQGAEPRPRPGHDAARFGALEEELRAPAVEPATGARMERFEKQVSDPPLALSDESPEAQPFARCAKCAADNSRFATHCGICGADLGAEDQKRFNTELWTARRAEAERERQELDVLRTNRARAEDEHGRAMRQAAESMAQEVGAATRRRLEGGELGRAAGTSVGLRILRGIGDPNLRLGAAAAFATLGLTGLLLFFFSGNPALSSGGLLGVFLLIGLFTPPRWRPRKWWKA